uniref:Fungal lipase-type domain-containing protein n=1 Tax=Tetradesmus obliquus TaxID=3088 RepID=A0A383VHB2_TETOB|eukprot:jgi/Sobl393_1/3583/SZX63786.1
MLIVLVLTAAAAVAAQPSTSTWGGFTPRPTIAFQCQQLPQISGAGSQTYRLECWSNDIPVGRTAEGRFDWKSGMTPATRITAVQLTLVGQPVNIAEGVDYLSLSGSFTAGRTTLPACAAQTRFALSFDQTVTTPLTFTKPRKGRSSSSGSIDSQHKQSCSGLKLNALAPADGSSTRSDPSDATVSTWRPGVHVPTTPDGLRVRLTCQKGSAGGVCSAYVRLQVQFNNSSLPQTIDAFEDLSREMEAKEGFKCADRSWMDATGLLGLKNATINTEVCYPPATLKRTGSNGRRLAAAVPAGTPAKQTPDMAPVLAYDTPIIAKATRLARYASAIHGCLPTTPSSDQTYTAADGSTQKRQWDGPTGMSHWGGPGINGQPGPECRSCFKDGIDFVNNPPQGFQTPEFSYSTPTSFLDAAIVFTDTAVSGVAGQKAVVVLFRATASAVQASQWLSNVGLCAGSSGKQASPSDDPASGSVCDGWNTPVVDLIALGLLKDVLLRLDALPPADRTVYVTGHSRGGALAAVFAAKLLALQAAGTLPKNSGAAVDQIKLYTFGSPRVGDTFFAAYLENNMRERYRIVTRYDAVPTAPSESSSYSHFRPSIWYRDSSGNPTASPLKGCVLFDQNQLTTLQKSCFISCNSVLTCAYGAGVSIPGSSTASPQCTDLTENQILTLSGTTAAGSTTLIDHASYLGLDMNNNGCRADVAFINAITITPGYIFDSCDAV